MRDLINNIIRVEPFEEDINSPNNNISIGRGPKSCPPPSGGPSINNL